MKIALALNNRGGLSRHLRHSKHFLIHHWIDGEQVATEERGNPRHGDDGCDGAGHQRHHVRCGNRGDGAGEHRHHDCTHDSGNQGPHHRRGRQQQNADLGPRPPHGRNVPPRADHQPHQRGESCGGGRRLVSTLADCDALIARGIGTSARVALRAAGVRPIVIDEKISPQQALELFLEERL